MNKQRLEYTRQKLLDLHARKVPFDINVWGDTQPDLPDGATQCGFAGCIVGWAAHEGWWEPMGLKVELFAPPAQTTPLRSPRITMFDGKTTSLENANVSLALGRFFGVSLGTIDALILPDAYAESPSAQDCADRIQRLIELGEDDFLDTV